MHRPVVAALIGNPNAGKTTLFNALSGLRQRTGNYPGVTVEMKKGRTPEGDTVIELVDLPGTYSLAPRSPDEMLAVDVLLGRQPGEPRPDVVVAVADASNLDRHLYLTTQLLELGLPVVVALTMTDVADAHGTRIDAAALAEKLGVPVVPVLAARGVGLADLRRAVVAAAAGPAPAGGPEFPPAFEREVDRVLDALGKDAPRFLARRVLIDAGGTAEARAVHDTPSLRDELAAARLRLREAGCPVPAAEARARYGWLRGVLAASVRHPDERRVTWTDRLDAVLTHRVWGTLAFALLMFGVFEAIFVGAAPLMEAISGGLDALAGLVRDLLPPGPVAGLLADGVVKGVGSVLVFLPQILILFAFIAVLEDCGYMARAAFLMDRLMSRCGLSGKSFIPMLSSLACAIPGVMATRVIENRRDRLATILVAPLMSCSARLPVYAMVIGAFLSEPWWLPGVVLFGMYLVGLVAAPLVALLLKRTLLRGETPLFVMELPLYRRPSLFTVLRRVYDAGAAFVVRAGTLILATMVLVWALLYFPAGSDRVPSYDAAVTAERQRAERLKADGRQDEAEAAGERANELLAEWRGQSWLGRAGKALEPAFRPLGWNWEIGMAALASFPAREVVVGTLGMIYGRGEDAGEEDVKGVLAAKWSDAPGGPAANVPRAVSLMVFFALCCQCVSTLAVIRRETNSWAWPAFAFAYMTALAYVAALVTFQVGRLLVG